MWPAAGVRGVVGGAQRGGIRALVERARVAEVGVGVQQDVVLVGVGDRIQLQDGGLRGQWQFGEPRPQLREVAPGRVQHSDVGCDDGGGGFGVTGVARLRHPGEVGVRIEDEQGESSVQEQLLQHHPPEGVGLSRSALTAPEGVPVELVRGEDDLARRIVAMISHCQLNHD